MVNLVQMRYDWSVVIPALERAGWSAAELDELAAQAKADIASGDEALIAAWATWLSRGRSDFAGRRCTSCSNLRLPGIACAHARRPELPVGHCAGNRPDLAPAYTPGHPLRRLPADGGVSCPAWNL